VGSANDESGVATTGDVGGTLLAHSEASERHGPDGM
jgi:hypothetical protein